MPSRRTCIKTIRKITYKFYLANTSLFTFFTVLSSLSKCRLPLAIIIHTLAPFGKAASAKNKTPPRRSHHDLCWTPLTQNTACKAISVAPRLFHLYKFQTWDEQHSFVRSVPMSCELLFLLRVLFCLTWRMTAVNEHCRERSKWHSTPQKCKSVLTLVCLFCAVCMLLLTAAMLWLSRK